MRIEVHHYHQADSAVRSRLDLILHKLSLLETRIMATLDQLIEDTAEETTLIGSVSTLIQGLQVQIKDALKGEKLTPEAQAKVDEVFKRLEANKAALADAVASNTPAEGTDVEAPGDGSVPE